MANLPWLSSPSGYISEVTDEVLCGVLIIS